MISITELLNTKKQSHKTSGNIKLRLPNTCVHLRTAKRRYLVTVKKLLTGKSQNNARDPRQNSITKLGALQLLDSMIRMGGQRENGLSMEIGMKC